MIFVSHDRTFLRGLSNRVLELGGESGTDAQPHAYPGSYVEYVAAHRPRGAGGARLTGSALCGPRLGMGRAFLSCRSGRHHRTDFRSPHHRALAVDLKPGLVAVLLRHQHSYWAPRNLSLRSASGTVSHTIRPLLGMASAHARQSDGRSEPTLTNQTRLAVRFVGATCERASRASHANGASRRSGERESVWGSPRGEAPRMRTTSPLFARQAGRAKRASTSPGNHPIRPRDRRAG